MVRIVCGLGNPGAAYQGTRHNVGFEVVDRLVRRWAKRSPVEYDWFDNWPVAFDRWELAIIKPVTYMNLAGLAAEEACRRFGCNSGAFFVILDDFRLPLGTIRIRKSGSSGGHKGMASIVDALGSGDFPRLRLGIGPLPPTERSFPKQRSEFVLSRFFDSEKGIVETMIEQAAEAVETVIKNGLDRAINRYNGITPTPDA